MQHWYFWQLTAMVYNGCNGNPSHLFVSARRPVTHCKTVEVSSSSTAALPAVLCKHALVIAWCSNFRIQRDLEGRECECGLTINSSAAGSPLPEGPHPNIPGVAPPICSLIVLQLDGTEAGLYQDQGLRGSHVLKKIHQAYHQILRHAFQEPARPANFKAEHAQHAQQGVADAITVRCLPVAGEMIGTLAAAMMEIRQSASTQILWNGLFTQNKHVSQLSTSLM